MKTAEITEGRDYIVKLGEYQAYVYGGAHVRAKVLRAGFHYEVERVTGSAVRGAPFKRRHESARATGVEVEWETQDVRSNGRHGLDRVHAGRATVNARQVLYPAAKKEAA